MKEFIGKVVYHNDRYWMVVDFDEWSESLVLEDMIVAGDYISVSIDKIVF